MSKKNFEAVRTERWHQLVGKLSPASQAALSGQVDTRNEEARTYDKLLEGLSTDAREALTPSNRMADIVVQPDAPADRHANYVLIEQIEGDWIKLKVYKKPQDMVKRIDDLEKSNPDSCVFALYGMHLPITKSPDRMLILPNDTVLRVKTGKFVRSIDGPLRIQDDGFLGPDDMAVVEKPHNEDDETED